MKLKCRALAGMMLLAVGAFAVFAGLPTPANAGESPAGFQIDRLSCEVSIVEPGCARVTYSFDATVTADGLKDFEGWAFHTSEMLLSTTVNGQPIPVAEVPVDQNTHLYDIGFSHTGLKPGRTFHCVMVTERHTPSICWHEYIGSDSLHIMPWRLNEFRLMASPACRAVKIVLDIPEEWTVFWGTPLGSGGPLDTRALTLPLSVIHYNTWLFAGPFIALGQCGPATVYGFEEDLGHAGAITEAVSKRHEAVLEVLGRGGITEPLPLGVVVFHRAPKAWGIGCPGLVAMNWPAGGNVAGMVGVLGHELVHSYLTPKGGLDLAAHWINEGLATYVGYLQTGVPWVDRSCSLANAAAAAQYTVAEISADTGDLRQQFLRDLIYHKPAWIMRMLHSMMGDSFFRACVAFANLDSPHPLTEQAFADTISGFSGQNLGWFFEQWVHTTKAAAFRIPSLTSRVEGGRRLLAGMVENTLDAYVPSVTVAVSTRGGEVARVTCAFTRESEAASFEVVIPRWTGVVSVQVDPDSDILKTGDHPAFVYYLAWYRALRGAVLVGAVVCGGFGVHLVRKRRRAVRDEEVR